LHAPLQDWTKPDQQNIKVACTKSSKQGSEIATRCSPRIHRKIKKYKPTIKLTQEVLAKKWNILGADKEMDDLTLQQYLDFYKRPLSHLAIFVVNKMTKMTTIKKKKKKKKKKKY
jgi:hypothetical protein